MSFGVGGLGHEHHGQPVFPCTRIEPLDLEQGLETTLGGGGGGRRGVGGGVGGLGE